jgi:hypothetical protein
MCLIDKHTIRLVDIKHINAIYVVGDYVNLLTCDSGYTV